ncbi:lytic transglycosylase domain-containing protein [Geodermatophilus poikilotrophus]|uniref:Cell wall-associated hydrolase, NlpC family n=1 Tax=Geodermatophilus poikilotrophus TaxID=1333667 RepID=A0A1I0IIF6_9ACTN|nr:transglycosylase SLT domain-containing protein [Geodermatophilus poikilotrophus]SET96669.1 Cell wall-associated hydrolase, NlpC family [Geodermatophilus poikilotrophus]
MDGLTAVQSRISEIQARFLTAPRPAASADWTAAATAAGLAGTGATSAAAGTATAGSASEGAVVAEARKYLGVPYLWGGTDPAKGLDCSGFTQLVYGNLGIDLPRTSSQQATAGTAVASLAEARPGDLVFFDHSPGRPGIDHVGIYVGDGKMIAAPQAGEVVKVQDVGNPAVIRRVLPAETASTGSGTATGASLSGVPYADLFTRAGSRHGVDPALLAAVAKQESGFNASAVSPAGAQGLMQFMPATARGLGVDPLDPASAVDGAARYLAGLTEQFGSTELGLAAYNAGPGTVRRYGGIPPYAETQNYVRSVMSKAEALR